MSTGTFRPGDRFRVADRGDEHDGSTGVVRSTFITSDGEEFAHVLHDDGSLTMWETSRLLRDVTFAPGTRVRRSDNGRTGTVDYTAVETDLLAEHPGMVPVAYDGDDAWLTVAHVLEPMPSAARRASMTSSDAIETERLDRVMALCENCGATREVSRRAIRDSRPLRCANCKSTTRHWLVGVRDDYRERANALTDEARARFDEDLRFLAALGVHVFAVSGFADPQTDGVDVQRFLDAKGGVEIRILGTLPIKERHDALRWAVRYMLPTGPSWDGPTYTYRGRPVKGIHRLKKGA